jgi:hypothetical protein
MTATPSPVHLLVESGPTLDEASAASQEPAKASRRFILVSLDDECNQRKERDGIAA